MSFTGSEDHSISLNDAAKMTKNYRDRNPGQIKAHFFGKDTIQSILDQDDCVGIRIYYALDDNGVKHLVISGVKADESDLYNGILAEKSWPCPPYCGDGSPL
jgi:hypothetical protein